MINVGCVSSYVRSSGRAISAVEAFMSAIDYLLESVSRVPYGETVRMKLTLRNVDNDPVQFFTGGRPPHDFVVTTVDGEEVWYWKCRQIGLQGLAIESLEPGEELEFVSEWQQVDTWGEPVPAGTYLVRRVLNLEPSERLETAPHELHVLR